jgi:hypothetical protein
LSLHPPRGPTTYEDGVTLARRDQGGGPCHPFGTTAKKSRTWAQIPWPTSRQAAPPPSASFRMVPTDADTCRPATACRRPSGVFSWPVAVAHRAFFRCRAANVGHARLRTAPTGLGFSDLDGNVPRLENGGRRQVGDYARQVMLERCVAVAGYHDSLVGLRDAEGIAGQFGCRLRPDGQGMGAARRPKSRRTRSGSGPEIGRASSGSSKTVPVLAARVALTRNLPATP